MKKFVIAGISAIVISCQATTGPTLKTVEIVATSAGTFGGAMRDSYFMVARYRNDPDNDMQLVNESNWHIFKYVESIGWATTHFCFGYELGKGEKRWKLAKRYFGLRLTTNVLWNRVYFWGRFNRPFWFEPERNTFWAVYITFKDGKIVDGHWGFKTPAQGILLETLSLIGGIWLIIKN